MKEVEEAGKILLGFRDGLFVLYSGPVYEPIEFGHVNRRKRFGTGAS